MLNYWNKTMENLLFDLSLAKKYKSRSQKIRVMSENWVKSRIFCPICGGSLLKCPNNQPVSDFMCKECMESFELKSKGSQITKKLLDGCYETALKRIKEQGNPHLFVLEYKDFSVVNLTFVPKFFFTKDVIEARAQLGINARRAGWHGCNILYGKIVTQGKIPIVRDGQFIKKEIIMEAYQKCKSLFIGDTNKRIWMFDVLKCVNKIKKEEFSLRDIYAYEAFLKTIHPENNNISAKIRQQLQILRDKKVISFLGNGQYKKL